MITSGDINQLPNGWWNRNGSSGLFPEAIAYLLRKDIPQFWGYNAEDPAVSKEDGAKNIPDMSKVGFYFVLCMYLSLDFFMGHVGIESLETFLVYALLLHSLIPKAFG